MTAIDATRILLHRGRTTNKLRKQCARARETSMLSATPIYKEEEAGQPTEYFSSKASEVTPEQRLARKLRRATLAQLHKWALRNSIRQSACVGIVARIPENSPISHLRRRERFTILANHHGALNRACVAEIDRRNDAIAIRAQLKAEHV